MRKIVVNRVGIPFDLIRNYEISVNGVKKKIGYNQTIEILVDENSLKNSLIKAEVDWCSSDVFNLNFTSKDEVSFDVRVNEYIALSCYLALILLFLSFFVENPLFKYIAIVLGFIYFLGITLFRRKYLGLKCVND